VVATDTLSVLAEIYGEYMIALPGSMRDPLVHVTRLLDSVAMGEAARGDADSVPLYRKRLASYAEAVLCRAVGKEIDAPEMQAAMNGFMGSTMRWASESPAALPDALLAWEDLLYTACDNNQDSSPLIETAFGALARLCAERCMLSTNGDVLRKLDVADDDEDDDDDNDDDEHGNGSWGDTKYEDNGNMLSSIACSPSFLGTSLLRGSGGHDAGSNEAVVEGGDSSFINRDQYVRRCVDTLASCSSVLSGTIASHTAQLATEVLASELSPPAQIIEAMADKLTATKLASAMSPFLGQTSPTARSLMQEVASLLVSPDVLANWQQHDAQHSKLLVGLLLAATKLAPTLGDVDGNANDWSIAKAITSALVQVCRDLVQPPISKSNVPIAAALLLSTLGTTCATTSFESEPPFSPSVVAATIASNRAVCTLGVVSMTRWSLRSGVLENAGTVIQDVRAAQASSVKQCCKPVFESYMLLCSHKAENLDIDGVHSLTRGSLLARSVFFCVSETKALPALWTGIVCELCLASAQVQVDLSKVAGIGSLDEEQRRSVPR
jgi:hypothetical protein